MDKLKIAKAIGVLFLILILAAGVTKWWNLPVTHTVQDTIPGPGKTTSGRTGTCDLRIRTVSIRKNERVEINPDGRCAVFYIVQQGSLEFSGPKVPVKQQSYGNQLTTGVQGIITHAVATSDMTQLQYQLCPPNHREPNWCS